jgi:multicomponent Na+:H+ antiporter subunit B
LKILTFFALIFWAVFLAYASYGLSIQGEHRAFIHQEKNILHLPLASSHYIEHAMKDSQTPNMVTAVLGDYRSFDTLGEEVVIFAAGIICFLLLRREKRDEKWK